MMKERMLALVLVLAILSSWGCRAGKQAVPEPTLPPPSLAEPDGQVLVVTASLLNLRICPSMGCQIIAGLPRGQEVIKLGAEAGWLRVRVPAIQKEGWVGAHYVAMGGPKPVVSPPPPDPPPPEAKEEWAVPDKQTAPVEEEQITPEDQAAPEVKEEWATPEKQEVPEVKEEGAAPEGQIPPEVEVKEEFAK